MPRETYKNQRLKFINDKLAKHKELKDRYQSMLDGDTERGLYSTSELVGMIRHHERMIAYENGRIDVLTKG